MPQSQGRGDEDEEEDGGGAEAQAESVHEIVPGEGSAIDGDAEGAADLPGGVDGCRQRCSRPGHHFRGAERG